MRDKFKLLKNKKILITGNTGFIGSWLSLALHELEADILGISKELKKNYISSTKEYQKNIKTIKIDIKNIHLKRKAILKFKPEYIIHLASQPIVTDSYRDPIYTFDNNIISTTKFLEFIKNIKSIKKIIIFTSDKVYKNSKKELSENDSLGGSDPYSVSKACQDMISNFYASKDRFEKTKNELKKENIKYYHLTKSINRTKHHLTIWNFFKTTYHDDKKIKQIKSFIKKIKIKKK